jgi:hypothetical protein
LLAVSFAGAASAEQTGRRLFTTQSANGEIAGWKSFHADPNTKTGDVWKLSADGVLLCKGTPQGYLYTEQQLTDVRLELEWRWPPEAKPGSGGLLLRMTGEHRIWPKSLEVQLNHGQAGDFWGLAGYGLIGAAERMESLESPKFGKLTHVKFTQPLEKPAGQWNHCAVELRGDRISVRINGQQVNVAERCDAAAGPLVLTAEGAEIHFRNVILLEP